MRKLKIIHGYSTSNALRELAEAKGHEVWTCDLRPADHPRHLQCDIWEVARRRDWDFGLFHPMCTYLTVSAAFMFRDPDFDRWPDTGYHQKMGPDVLTGAARRAAREQALDNFWLLDNLPYPHAIENPGRSFLNTMYRPADCIVQPYEHGEDISKTTGFWTSPDLPPIRPTAFVPPRIVEYRGRKVKRWGNQSPCGAPKAPPGVDRWLERSTFYPGVARATMQWVDFLAEGVD